MNQPQYINRVVSGFSGETSLLAYIPPPPPPSPAFYVFDPSGPVFTPRAETAAWRRKFETVAGPLLEVFQRRQEAMGMAEQARVAFLLLGDARSDRRRKGLEGKPGGELALGEGKCKRFSFCFWLWSFELCGVVFFWGGASVSL